MPRPSEQLQRAALERLSRVKTLPEKFTPAMGEELIKFFKQSVEKRQGKFGKIADAWGRLIPPAMLEHCALESFSRGVLVIVVDSSPHLYEMKQLLLSGLQKQLLLACKAAGLKKINLKPGRWYNGSDGADKRLTF